MGGFSHGEPISGGFAAVNRNTQGFVESSISRYGFVGFPFFVRMPASTKVWSFSSRVILSSRFSKRSHAARISDFTGATLGGETSDFNPVFLPIRSGFHFHESSTVGFGQIALLGEDTRIDECLESFVSVHFVPTLLSTLPSGLYVQTTAGGKAHSIKRLHVTEIGLK